MADPTPPAGDGKPRPLSELASQLKNEIRAEVEQGIRDVVKKPRGAQAPVVTPDEALPSASQGCPGCGGSGTSQQGYTCGACGGRGWIGSS